MNEKPIYILTDCLSEKIDEGCLKVANTLIKKIKEKRNNTKIISYNKETTKSDIHINVNKLFLNFKLFSVLNEKECDVLYIPFASNTFATIIRISVLTIFLRKKVNVIFALRYYMNIISKMLLKLSGAKIIALSKESYDFYRENIGENVLYLKTGVDTMKFNEIDEKTKMKLRSKYGFNIDDKIVLHVGHLKPGRNVDKLMNIEKKYKVLLVVSSVTQKDNKLRAMLEKEINIKIIDKYIDKIEEVYQISDVYLFPVVDKENCIDVPLSVLEAASVNLPVLSTKYGELKEFSEENGFEYIEEFTNDNLNMLIDKSIKKKNFNNREAVMSYDWNKSVENLTKYING